MSGEPLSPLDYEDQPVVGHVVCQRADGVLTVRIRRSTAALAGGACGGRGHCADEPRARRLLLRRLSRAAVGVARLRRAARDGGNVLCPRAFSHRSDNRSRDADRPVARPSGDPDAQIRTRLDRRRPRRATLVQHHAAAPHVVNVVLCHGARNHLVMGTRAEVRYVADLLREELRLPPERWPEIGYPSPPRLSRVVRAIDPLGVALTLRPSLVPAWFAAAAPVLVAAALIERRTRLRSNRAGPVGPRGSRMGRCVFHAVQRNGSGDRPQTANPVHSRHRPQDDHAARNGTAPGRSHVAGGGGCGHRRAATSLATARCRSHLLRWHARIAHSAAPAPRCRVGLYQRAARARTRRPRSTPSAN